MITVMELIISILAGLYASVLYSKDSNIVVVIFFLFICIAHFIRFLERQLKKDE